MKMLKSKSWQLEVTGVADGCCGLMPSLTLGFGEGIKAFFGAVDDALVYIWE